MKASSIWPFSSPVERHWAMNFGWLRLAICAVTTADSGTVTSPISASNGEMMNIITSTPTTVSSEFTSWLIVCCRLCDTLSMSLVTRDSTSPRVRLSKYRSGNRCSLVSTVARRPYMVRATMPASR